MTAHELTASCASQKLHSFTPEERQWRDLYGDRGAFPGAAMSGAMSGGGLSGATLSGGGAMSGGGAI